MGGIRVTGLLMGSTSLDIKAGSVTKTIPVTVKSRNLLSYGPAEGNGLTATVNTDGSLHVTGTPTRRWSGLSWTFRLPVQETMILRTSVSISGLRFSVKFLDAKGGQLGDQLVSDGAAMAAPDGTVSLRLDLLSSEATPTMKNGDLKVQLESGDTAHEWMRPDNTSLRGGGMVNQRTCIRVSPACLKHWAPTRGLRSRKQRREPTGSKAPPRVRLAHGTFCGAQSMWRRARTRWTSRNGRSAITHGCSACKPSSRPMTEAAAKTCSAPLAMGRKP